jgi:hypothetical protein
MVGYGAKCVYLKVLQEVLRNFVEKPIQDHSTLYTTLRVEDENYFFNPFAVESLFDQCVAFANI